MRERGGERKSRPKLTPCVLLTQVTRLLGEENKGRGERRMHSSNPLPVPYLRILSLTLTDEGRKSEKKATKKKEKHE